MDVFFPKRILNVTFPIFERLLPGPKQRISLLLFKHETCRGPSLKPNQMPLRTSALPVVWKAVRRQLPSPRPRSSGQTLAPFWALAGTWIGTPGPAPPLR